PDIFNHTIIQANSNLIDALSAFAGILMCEGNEQTPLLLARGCDFIRFTSRSTLSELKIPAGQVDLWSPLLKTFKFK
ncbi:MAG: putative folate metabolism gamma-glutamate ligase, partial [Patescibacteria group bacterium]